MRPAIVLAVVCASKVASASMCADGMVPTEIGTCIDRYEWPNRSGARPMNGASALPESDALGTWDAEELCAEAGKRACRIEEWRQACAGSGAPPVVSYVAVPDEGALARRAPGLLEALAMAPTSGTHPKLAGATGAQDMRGGVEEWVRCAEGRDGWCLVGGHAARPGTCATTITAHAGAWHYHTTGFRCCSDGVIAGRSDAITLAPWWGAPFAPAALDPADGLALDAAMVMAIRVEVPWIHRPRGADYLAGVDRLAAIFLEVGAAGHIAGALDPWLLAAGSFFESRWQPAGADGDCERYAPVRVGCRSIGPMQINRNNARRRLGLSLRELRDPLTNVRAGYAELIEIRNRCGDVPVGLLFTGYTRGIGRGCPRSINQGGIRRCALLAAMLRFGERMPGRWRCGHEGQTLAPTTQALVDALATGTVGRNHRAVALRATTFAKVRRDWGSPSASARGTLGAASAR